MLSSTASRCTSTVTETEGASELGGWFSEVSGPCAILISERSSACLRGV